MKKTFIIVSFILMLSFFCSCAETTHPYDDIDMQSVPSAVSQSENIPKDNKHSSNETYVEYKEGIVKHSKIDPESDFAKSATEFIEAYLSKQYLENSDIESFEITELFIDMDATDWYVNINFDSGIHTNEEYINRVLAVGSISNIKILEDIEYHNTFADYDLNEPLERRNFVIYDPDNIYDWAECLEGFDWKIIDSSVGESKMRHRSDKELYEWLYADSENRTCYYIPIACIDGDIWVLTFDTTEIIPTDEQIKGFLNDYASIPSEHGQTNVQSLVGQPYAIINNKLIIYAGETPFSNEFSEYYNKNEWIVCVFFN